MKQHAQLAHHINKYLKSNEKSKLGGSILEIEDYLYKCHESHKEHWVTETMRRNIKDFFVFAIETATTRQNI